MKSKHIIDTENGVFVKKTKKGWLDLEIAMTEAAQKLANQEKTFAVPKVMETNKDKSIIKFELIENATSLRPILNRNLRLLAKQSHFELISEMFFRIGAILASIHNSEKIFDIVPKRPFPNNFLKSTHNDVYLHGDFTLHNLMYSKDFEKVIIIDWSTAAFLDFQANWGPNLWDINILISTIFFYSPSTILFSFIKRKKIIYSFLKGYQSKIEDPKKINTKELKDFLSKYNIYKLNTEINVNYLVRKSISMLRKFINEIGKKEEI